MDLSLPPPPRIEAILFDKDGTLFDFRATWDAWAHDVFGLLARGDAGRRKALAEIARYDLEARRFSPESPVIAGSNDEVAALFASVLPDRAAGDIADLLAETAADVTVVPPVPLEACLGGLIARGLRLGVMTNDAEAVAHAHLHAAGVGGLFDFVAGCDSGFGAKPDPAPLLAFSDALGVAPDAVAMVGDSTHDLVAARAAGMVPVAVLTGLAQGAELAPHAAVILPDIGHLEAWLWP
ncbi:Phosphoglycolate phosphatase [Roseivivax sp. THAF40]|uniref:HAD family hydrolase n=1 Tax=unclassified Roseivivax TaxID=2639302 RepID=UPI0012A8C78B|nr:MULTISPECIES: HAD family hydrolase [unclassified Roseivivax]QFS81693.1 Phosphoglycolate phosphatase [Roseivivax sp. THAF197b]QFT45485.1 Phosphoglycolate phosphatase [Roseivivax sp. THAF40]